ncbi:hypothetical protein VM98_18365 [Streptomyces rubellomurinus subsp. indigoferus]|nr:hypothetical protein VM98_18365 [Streptomyces rubellomurinus subsp. indigoferus]
MSRIITYSTADRADVVAFLGAAGRLTPDQRRRLDRAHEKARQRQADLDHQELDWGLSIPEALDHLLAGHADSEGSYAAGAYYAALQLIIDRNASDPSELGVYSRPGTFFSGLDEELRKLGVSEELLFHDHLFSGPPPEIPFRIPHPVDGPHIGMFPLAQAGPAAAAYRAVLDRLDQGLRYDVMELIKMFESESEHWEYATEHLDWYSQDTIFFSIVG